MTKRILPFLLLLSACQTARKETPKPPATDLQTLYRSQLTIDPDRLQVGQWVRYAAQENENAPRQSITFSVVRKSETGLWIENRVPGKGGIGTWIIKTKYSLRGDLLEQWVGEPGDSRPTRIDTGEKRPPISSETTGEVAVQTTKESITVAGHSYRTTKITTTLENTTLTNWCAKEIPFPARAKGRSRGGVVKRVFGTFRMELAAHGTDAREELPLP